MDGTASTATELRKQFRTPLRILLPKILAHRDGGKAESDARKAHRTAANVTLRDLRISRDYWRRRTAQAEAATAELRDRRTQAERDRDAARAARAASAAPNALSLELVLQVGSRRSCGRRRGS